MAATAANITTSAIGSQNQTTGGVEIVKDIFAEAKAMKEEVGNSYILILPL